MFETEPWVRLLHVVFICMIIDISDPVRSLFRVKYLPTDGSSNFIKSVNGPEINEGDPANVLKTFAPRRKNFLEISIAVERLKIS